ncbi:MAG: hypothetical protein ACLTBV_16085 [Enterocloster bolteae]
MTKMEDGRLSIDNQSGVSTSGEIILNVADDMTYILDAMSGLPGSSGRCQGRGYHLRLHRTGHDHEPSANDQCGHDFHQPSGRRQGA